MLSTSSLAGHSAWFGSWTEKGLDTDVNVRSVFTKASLRNETLETLTVRLQKCQQQVLCRRVYEEIFCASQAERIPERFSFKSKCKATDERVGWGASIMDVGWYIWSQARLFELVFDLTYIKSNGPALRAKIDTMIYIMPTHVPWFYSQCCGVTVVIQCYSSDGDRQVYVLGLHLAF